MYSRRFQDRRLRRVLDRRKPKGNCVHVAFFVVVAAIVLLYLRLGLFRRGDAAAEKDLRLTKPQNGLNQAHQDGDQLKGNAANNGIADNMNGPARQGPAMHVPDTEDDQKDALVKDWSRMSNEALSEHIHSVALAGNPAQRDRVGDDEFYWQMPLPLDQQHRQPSLQLRGNHAAAHSPYFPRAMLFVAHACHHSAADWFSSSHRSPEQEAIVDIARSRGVMVVAMSSLNRQNQCWDRHDAPRIARVLQYLETRQAQIVQTEQGSENEGAAFAARGGHIPLYAFGSSVGAMLISTTLPAAFRELVVQSGGGEQEVALDGIIVENVGARLDHKMLAVFITLPEEEEQHEQLDAALEEHPEELAKHIELPRQRLTRFYLSERLGSEWLTADQSSLLFDLLVELEVVSVPPDAYRHNNLQASYGNLVENPRHNPSMDRALAEFAHRRSGESIQHLLPAIVEALMVVWGKHAVTRDGVGEGLDWLLSKPDWDRGI